MTPRLVNAIMAIALAAIMTACQGNGNRDVPVPRRTAYSRMQLPPDSYRHVTIGGTALELNAAADTTGTVDDAANAWLTAVYPDGTAEVYITVNHAIGNHLDAMIDNRVERLSLNTGGAESQISSFTTPAGLDARIVVTPHATRTLIHIIRGRR
ncbi:MAG: hypothetical protein K2K86_00370, partial [Muribaculaceae bacterium]|nr:hypothetical protein [Muribaculaceae bacterium]